MKKILILTSLFFALLINIGGATAATSLFEFKDGFDLSKVSTSDSIVSLTDEKMLRIQTGHENNWPGVTLKAPDGKWDLSKCQYISFPVKNLDDKEAELFCRVDNPGADGVNHCITESVLVSAGESGVIKVPLYPSGIRLAKPVELIGMRTPPVGQSKIDTGNVVGLVIFVNRPKIDHDVAIGNITAGGDLKVINNKDFFPFIDQFGQYIHKEWPGKTHSLEELKAHGKAEKKDLVDNRPPTDRNKWGGWTGGPKLKATGFFRVEKYKDKWWFVDPDGRLFWSHGVNCVDNSTPTPITGRAEYFTLPKEEGAYADFYGEGSWAPVGYYKGKGKYKTYDYCRANLYQKYGTNWENVFADLAHKRIRSWGMNTIANWSDRRICLQRKTPYVCTIHHWGKELAGSEGYWGKFYDVFDESFRQGLQRSFEQVKGTAVGDAWCIGFFVDNELGWGDEVSLALAALTSPADQAAKKVFVDDLEAKYKNIDELNIVWGTKYTSWDGVLESTEAPDKKKAWEDLTAFYTKTAETYFKVVREELKNAAPEQLYMGCRFAWVNDRAAIAASKYSDVVCYNKYTYSVADLALSEGCQDRPIIIGEFHFGALDRGLFHPGLRLTDNQEHRAKCYEEYVQGALRDPAIIGTHWFQYKDQATTGRGDGENYQIGLLDICDRPYMTTIKTIRKVGYDMYEYRMKN